MSQLPYTSNPNMSMPPPPMKDSQLGAGYDTVYGGFSVQGCDNPVQGVGYPVQGGQPPAYPSAGYPAQPPDVGYGFTPAFVNNPAPTQYPPETVYSANPNGGFDYGKLEEGPNDVAISNDPGTFGASFSDKAIRRAFIKKVYLILSAQLLVTTAFIAVFVLHEGVKRYVHKNIWIYYLGFATFFTTYITLVCCPSVRRKYPGNVIALSVFTLAMSYMVGVISSIYDTKVVLMAGGTCVVICLAVSLFAMQTKFDFTLCAGFLIVALIIMTIFGFMMIFFRDNGIAQIVYSALGALLFTLFLAFDTQMIMGGKRLELSAEEYILGALQLYIDIVYIFLYLLSLFSRTN